MIGDGTTVHRITHQMPPEALPEFALYDTRDRSNGHMLLSPSLPPSRRHAEDVLPAVGMADGAIAIFRASCSLLGAPCPAATARATARPMVPRLPMATVLELLVMACHFLSAAPSASPR